MTDASEAPVMNTRAQGGPAEQGALVADHKAHIYLTDTGKENS